MPRASPAAITTAATTIGVWIGRMSGGSRRYRRTVEATSRTPPTGITTDARNALDAEVDATGFSDRERIVHPGLQFLPEKDPGRHRQQLHERVDARPPRVTSREPPGRPRQDDREDQRAKQPQRSEHRDPRVVRRGHRRPDRPHDAHRADQSPRSARRPPAIQPQCAREERPEPDDQDHVADLVVDRSRSSTRRSC